MRPLGFPRTLRLRRGAEFDAVFRRGASCGDALFVVHALPRPDGGPTRLGLSVGKDVGGAVRRNLVKRRVREAFRMNRAALPESTDLVVKARGAASADATLNNIVDAIVRLAKEARRRGDRRRVGEGGRPSP
jgi:ribonuclease P protein component